MLDGVESSLKMVKFWLHHFRFCKMLRAYAQLHNISQQQTTILFNQVPFPTNCLGNMVKIARGGGGGVAGTQPVMSGLVHPGEWRYFLSLHAHMQGILETSFLLLETIFT